MPKDIQSKIERNLRKKYKSKFEPVDFREKDTIRKVQLQWNKLNTAQKNRLSMEELAYIQEQSATNIRPQLYEEVSRIMSKKHVAERYSKLKPQQKAQKTRELNQGVKEQVRKLNIKKAIHDTGLRSDLGNELLLKVGKEVIPNPNMLDKTVDEVIEERQAINKMKPYSKRKSSLDIQEMTTQEWKEYKKAIKEYDVKDVQKKIRKLDRQSLKDATGLVDQYFKNSLYPEETEIIKAYLRIMSPKERYDIMQVLVSEKFKGEYDSDPKNSASNNMSYDEMLMTRQANIIQIMKNETGKIMTKSKRTRKDGKPVYVGKKAPTTEIDSSYTIANYI